MADETSVAAATTPPAAAESAPADPESAPAESAPCSAPPPAFVFGAGILPTALLAGILERARIREVRHPGADTPADPGYTPSRATADFVRCRDLTCRFPGCDKPAQVCDLDHTVAYPVGPDAPVKPRVSVSFSPLAENVLERRDRLAGPTTSRRDHRVDLTNRAHLCHVSGQQAPVPTTM